jgi:hypothetical protein
VIRLTWEQIERHLQDLVTEMLHTQDEDIMDEVALCVGVIAAKDPRWVG